MPVKQHPPHLQPSAPPISGYDLYRVGQLFSLTLQAPMVDGLGVLVTIRMNEPQKGFLLSAYKLYTRIFVKMTSRMLSNDSRAYDYLTTSMKVFANGKALIEILESHGFKLKKYKKFSFGVCSMYLVQKA